MRHHIVVRVAEVRDVAAIAALLGPYAERKIVLNRSQDNILQHLQEFMVAEYDAVVIGTAALHVYTPLIAEVRSLVVNPDYQGMQLGKMLVEECENRAAQLGVKQVFALTYVDSFFLRMGYSIVLKETLPHKIWTVCIHCDKFSACDEIAVVKYLSCDVPALSPLLSEQRND